MKCLLCEKKINKWKKCEIIIRTLGKWTKEKKHFYSTRLKPVCYSCVENMNFEKVRK